MSHIYIYTHTRLRLQIIRLLYFIYTFFRLSCCYCRYRQLPLLFRLVCVFLNSPGRFSVELIRIWRSSCVFSSYIDDDDEDEDDHDDACHLCISASLDTSPLLIFLNSWLLLLGCRRCTLHRRMRPASHRKCTEICVQDTDASQNAPLSD